MQVEKSKPPNVNVTQARLDIYTNLTCMQNQPAQGNVKKIIYLIFIHDVKYINIAWNRQRKWWP